MKLLSSRPLGLLIRRRAISYIYAWLLYTKMSNWITYTHLSSIYGLLVYYTRNGNTKSTLFFFRFLFRRLILLLHPTYGSIYILHTHCRFLTCLFFSSFYFFLCAQVQEPDKINQAKYRRKKESGGGLQRWRKDGIKADQEDRSLNISTYPHGRYWMLHPTTTTYCTIATTTRGADQEVVILPRLVVNGITAVWPVISFWRLRTTTTTATTAGATPAIIGSTRQTHSDRKTIWYSPAWLRPSWECSYWPQ